MMTRRDSGTVVVLSNIAHADTSAMAGQIGAAFGKTAR
jgi:hypothetical protein